MIDPLVSVVIPAYNRAEFLLRAIRSVTLQEYSALEIIVVDDGSNVAIADTLAQERDRRIRSIRRDRNGGAAVARNTGIQQARGSLVAFLDSDDEYLRGLSRVDADFFTRGRVFGFVFANYQEAAAGFACASPGGCRQATCG